MCISAWDMNELLGCPPGIFVLNVRPEYTFCTMCLRSFWYIYLKYEYTSGIFTWNIYLQHSSGTLIRMLNMDTRLGYNYRSSGMLTWYIRPGYPCMMSVIRNVSQIRLAYLPWIWISIWNLRLEYPSGISMGDFHLGHQIHMECQIYLGYQIHCGMPISTWDIPRGRLHGAGMFAQP